MMQLSWEDIATGNAHALLGQMVRLEGRLSTRDLAGRRALVAEWPPTQPTRG